MTSEYKEATPASAEEVKALTPFFFPGDWERGEAVWYAWMDEDNARNRPFNLPFFQILRGYHGHQKVNLVVRDAATQEKFLAAAKAYSPPLPTDHLTFFHAPNHGPWMRDMGPQFVRSSNGRLAITDWNFNSWGFEEPEEPSTADNERVHRILAKTLNVPLIPVRKGPNGVRMIHEGGSVAHNGSGTMIAIESVAMQRNLGPKRFYPGAAPISDLSSPTTYRPSPEWDACRAQLTEVYRESLGVTKLIWVPTGVMEDDGTYRGPIGQQFKIDEYDGKRILHKGVYTLYTTNGHGDEFVRFIKEDTVLLARSDVTPLPANPTPLDKLRHYIEGNNHTRMEAARAIIEKETTADGKPLKVVRMPTAELMFEVLEKGDAMYDMFDEYRRWDEGDKDRLHGPMFSVLPTSYCNYFPTADVVVVARYWREGRPQAMKEKDAEAVRVLSEAFPGRTMVPVDIENVNLGGGGIHCISQQHPLTAVPKK